jgi:hypothetical protein
MFAPPLLADKSCADNRKYAIALMIAPILCRERRRELRRRRQVPVTQV